MLTVADFPAAKTLISKNFVTDQTYGSITFRLNSAGRAFDAVKGLGVVTATSTVAVLHCGGFNDQRITGVVRYVSPTVSGGEDVGMTVRFQSMEDTASSNYYYARISGGFARLTKVIANVYTNLSSAAFVVAQDVDVTIVLSCVGSALAATFTAASGPAPVSLSAVDTSVPAGGLMGWRTLTSTGYLKSYTAEQL